MAMEESVTYQEIVAEGIAKGRAEGELRGARELLRTLGDRRFGAPSAEITAALEAIDDLNRLRQLALRLDEVSRKDPWVDGAIAIG
jgi:predicted transposase YdaD